METIAPPKKVKKQSNPKACVLWTHEIVEYSPFGFAVPAVDFPFRKLPKQVLLDTPTLDLLIRQPNQLSHNALRLINECEEGSYISAATMLEWADWVRKGHYRLEVPLNIFFEQIIQNWQLQILPLSTEAYAFYADLVPVIGEVKMSGKENGEGKARKMVHEDTYDQLIMAQAIVDKIPLITPHAIFKQYERFGLKWVW